SVPDASSASSITCGLGYRLVPTSTRLVSVSGPSRSTSTAVSTPFVSMARPPISSASLRGGDDLEVVPVGDLGLGPAGPADDGAVLRDGDAGALGVEVEAAEDVGEGEAAGEVVRLAVDGDRDEGVGGHRSVGLGEDGATRRDAAGRTGRANPMFRPGHPGGRRSRGRARRR